MAIVPMSIVARCGSVALLLGLAIAVPAVAQDTPKSSGSWTDPPVRGAAGPAVKPGEGKASGTTTPTAQAPAAPAAVGTAKPSAPQATAAAKPALMVRPTARRAFAFRRYPTQVRHFAVRPPRAVAAARPSWGARLRIAALHEQGQPHRARRAAAVVARRDAPAASSRRHAAYRFRQPNRDVVYDDRPYDGPAEPPLYARRAGWGGLLGDDQGTRVAQARAAGYRVMRLRTYEYPDGSRVQRLMPYDPEDDLD